MKHCYELTEYDAGVPSVVTLGKFDGVHRGHQLLISAVRRIAEEKGLQTVVFTFAVSPQVMMGRTAGKMLMTAGEKCEAMERYGIDTLLECSFTPELRSMEPAAFVREVLLGKLNAAAVVAGADFHFGRNREGDAELLRRMSADGSFSVEIIGKEKDEVTGKEISSTLVREELEKGNIETVNRLLGHRYSIEGEVVHGQHLGRTIGVPTINILPAPEKLLPPAGVYVSLTRIGGTVYRGITNVGMRPTVNGKFSNVETHLIDVDLDAYGKEARVELLQFCRPERKFESIEALTAQMKTDIGHAREVLRGSSAER